jgi:DNA-binding transcriptional regulator YhcF (GntR family)
MTGFYVFGMTTLKSKKRSWRGITSLIVVDRRSVKPLYQQIYDSFRTKIMHGDFRGGEAVPSSRELARDLRISRLPVLNAYAQLQAEGHFETRMGSGTFVAKTIRTQARPEQPRRDRRAARRRSISTGAKGFRSLKGLSGLKPLGPSKSDNQSSRAFRFTSGRGFSLVIHASCGFPRCSTQILWDWTLFANCLRPTFELLAGCVAQPSKS